MIDAKLLFAENFMFILLCHKQKKTSLFVKYPVDKIVSILGDTIYYIFLKPLNLKDSNSVKDFRSN